MRDHSPNIMSEYLEIEDRIAEAMEWKSEHPDACPITKLAEIREYTDSPLCSLCSLRHVMCIDAT